jgi:hypothetical protein
MGSEGWARQVSRIKVSTHILKGSDTVTMMLPELSGVQAHVLSHLIVNALTDRPELSAAEQDLYVMARYIQDIIRQRRLK